MPAKPPEREDKRYRIDKLHIRSYGFEGFFYDTFAVAAAVAGRVLRVALVYCTDWCEIC